MVGVLEHQIAGRGVGDDLFQIAQVHVLLNGDQLRRRIQGHDLAVVAIGKGRPVRRIGAQQSRAAQETHGWGQNAGQPVLSRPDADVEIGPAGIDIAVQPVEPTEIGLAARLLRKGAGGRLDPAPS